MITVQYRKELGSQVILTTYPVVNVVSILSLNETIINGSFTATFRYTTDGINFSESIVLSEINLTSLTFQESDRLQFEFTYNKQTPESELGTVELEEQIGTLEYNETYYQTSNFKKFFDSTDNELVSWYINVLQKIYSENDGVAKFINRKDLTGSDKDFIDFWTSITRFFAYFVVYARRYQNLHLSEDLLREFLQQRGLFISLFDNIEELQYLLEHFNNQIFHRGTNKIQQKKYDEIFDENGILVGGQINEVDGELLRLISYKTNNEFLFNVHRPQHFGWNLGNSSPLYRGLELNSNLYKVTSSSQTIKVNLLLSYEIVFKIRTNLPLTVKVFGFDSQGNSVDLVSQRDGVITDTCIDNVVLLRDDKDILVRVCVYEKDFPINSQMYTSLNQGNNLVFVSESINFIRTVIYLDGEEVVLTSENNFRINPIWTNYSHGLLQVYNWISCWLVNNNYTKTIQQIKQYIRKYLIPYNSHLELTNLFPSNLLDSLQVCDYSILIQLCSYSFTFEGPYDQNCFNLYSGYGITVSNSTVGPSVSPTFWFFNIVFFNIDNFDSLDIYPQTYVPSETLEIIGTTNNLIRGGNDALSVPRTTINTLFAGDQVSIKKTRKIKAYSTILNDFDNTYPDIDIETKIYATAPLTTAGSWIITDRLIGDTPFYSTTESCSGEGKQLLLNLVGYSLETEPEEEYSIIVQCGDFEEIVPPNTLVQVPLSIGSNLITISNTYSDSYIKFTVNTQQILLESVTVEALIDGEWQDITEQVEENSWNSGIVSEEITEWRVKDSEGNVVLQDNTTSNCSSELPTDTSFLILVNGKWQDVTSEIVEGVWFRSTSDSITEWKIVDSENNTIISGQPLVENCRGSRICSSVYVTSGYWDCNTYP